MDPPKGLKIINNLFPKLVVISLSSSCPTHRYSSLCNARFELVNLHDADRKDQLTFRQVDTDFFPGLPHGGVQRPFVVRFLSSTRESNLTPVQTKHNTRDRMNFGYPVCGFAA